MQIAKCKLEYVMRNAESVIGPAVPFTHYGLRVTCSAAICILQFALANSGALWAISGMRPLALLLAATLLAGAAVAGPRRHRRHHHQQHISTPRTPVPLLLVMRTARDAGGLPPAREGEALNA